MPSLHITPSGGLLTHQFVEAVQQTSFNNPAAAPETFALPGKGAPSPSELDRAIGAAWELLVERWDSIERDLLGMDISTLRERWIRPLFQMLEFDLEYQRADLVLEDDLHFAISHLANPFRVGDIQVPLHSVLPNPSGLDVRRGTGAGLKRLAPHDLLQRYLNLAPDVRWGFLSDGLRLRLLRDYHHTYTRGYIEFDLQGIFNGRDFAAFRGLYRLCHASRFMPMAAPIDKKKKSKTTDEGSQTEGALLPLLLSPLEAFYQHALSTGVKVGEDLRENVRIAIETLANGFLMSTPGLLSSNEANGDEVSQLYRDILYAIYRVLFLLFAEQRGMLPGRGSIYMDEYSLTALRARAELPLGEDEHTDLWEKLKVTFRMVEHGVPELRVYAYNGVLFSPGRTPILTPTQENESQLPIVRNDALLRATRALTTIERGGVLQRISYADISVEEIGSVYESLLEFIPRIAQIDEKIDDRVVKPGQFFLDPRGKERKSSGSYYTNPTLVNELIVSILIPVMGERLLSKIPGYDQDHPELLSLQQREDAEEVLLNLKVVDPSAGSGAFLIAANNTLGLRLAQIRAGDLYPSEHEVRRARRDVLAHCIYAVDLNPMAVELCRVSLWINAAVQDAPLNFLNHHIRCGNSLVGARSDLVQKGIPDEAYNPENGDDKVLATSWKKRNAAEREGQLSLLDISGVAPSDLHEDWVELNRLSEDSPAKAEEHYTEYLRQAVASPQHQAADLWVASFFWLFKQGEIPPPTTSMLSDGGAVTKQTREVVYKKSEELAQAYRFFHWEYEFADVFSEGKGFDVVIGNPPFSAELGKTEKVIKKIYSGLSTTNSAALFIALGMKISKPNGKIGFVCPKSITYSSKWTSVRDLIFPFLFQIIDCGKAWEEVLLEQVLLSIDKQNASSLVRTGIYRNGEISNLQNVSRSVMTDQDVIYTDIEEIFLDIVNRQNSRRKLGDIVKTNRGLGLQKYLSTQGTLPVLGGRNISRYKLNGQVGFLNSEEAIAEFEKFNRPKALYQNLVAHILNPKPHIKLIGTIDYENHACLDTVNMIFPLKEEITVEGIVGIINSKFINWLVYRLLYNKAIRTMHFDQYFLDKIPIPDQLLTYWPYISERVQKIIELQQGDRVINDQVNRELDEINHVVFQSYGCTNLEIEQILAEFPQNDL